MEGIMVLFAIIFGLAALGGMAVRFGVDSTWESTDPHSPAADLTF